ncbi:MAG: LytTR family DNA-binding domain-containing protein [Pseudomonadota bacterium]
MADRLRRVVIVDDEPAARFALRNVIDSFDELELVGEIEDGVAAVDAIQSLRPDLVFLDIDMPGVDGFGVATATTQVPYHLVYVTAHHGYALEAFDTQAVDFLLKPARPSLIRKCIDKILRQEEVALEHLMPQQASQEHLVLIDSGVSRVLAFEHILLIGAIDRYRRLLLTESGAGVHGQNMLLSDTTLDDFMEQLGDSGFLRVHRSYIINVRFIVAMRTENRRQFVTLEGCEDAIPVARPQVRTVRRALGK